MLHSLIVRRLGIGQRQSGVDLQRLACGMSRVGLDQRIINPFYFEPSEEEMSPFVRRYGARNTRLGRVSSQHFAHTSICVFVLAHRLEQVDGPFCPHLFHVEREQFTKGARKGYLAVLAPFPLCNGLLGPAAQFTTFRGRARICVKIAHSAHVFDH
jgi:hypothetical protein